jgi:hypothetical protein
LLSVTGSDHYRWDLVSGASIEFPSNGDDDAESAEEEREWCVDVTKPPTEYDVSDHCNDGREGSHVLECSRLR